MTPSAPVRHPLARHFSIVAIAAVLLFGFAGMASAQQTIRASVVNGHPPVFLWVSELSNTFLPTVDALLEGSGYQIEWQEFYGGTLAPVGGELEALEAGLAEVGVVPTVFEPSNMPLQNVTYVTPFGSTDPIVVADIMNDLHEDIPAMQEAWDRFGLVYLANGGFTLDNYLLMTTFPVGSLADLAGKKIGAPGAAVNWLDGTGAVGVSGNLTTYYNDIQTGVYDGVIVFATAAAPANLQEVAPYITRVDFGAQYAGSLVATRDWFEAQPEEVQNAIREATKAYGESFAANLVARSEASLQAMVEGGGIINDVPQEFREAWAASLPNVPQQWAEQLDAQGLPGSEVLSRYMDALREAGVDLPRDWDLE